MWNIFFIAITGSFLVDQITKILVIKFHIPYYLNTFGPLGVRAKYPKLHRIIRVTHAAIFIGMLVSLLQDSSNFYFFLGAGLVIGGSLGNIFDHKVKGGAVDFIPLPFPTFTQKWAKGNISDLEIIAGFVVFGIGITYFLLSKTV